MNYKRANLEICKELANNELVRGQEVSENMIIIIPESGYYGYFFDKKSIVFNMDKVRMIDSEARKVADLSIVIPENEISISKDLRILDYKHAMARKFTKDGKEVLINNSFLRNLDVYATKFYQDKSNDLSVVIAVEDGVPSMCILPIKTCN